LPDNDRMSKECIPKLIFLCVRVKFVRNEELRIYEEAELHDQIRYGGT
jgi:hypothetical protein